MTVSETFTLTVAGVIGHLGGIVRQAQAVLLSRYPRLRCYSAKPWTCRINGIDYAGVEMGTDRGILNLYIRIGGEPTEMGEFENLILLKGYAFQLLSKREEKIFN